MQAHFFNTIQLIKRLGIILFLYTLCRIIFYVMNASHFPNFDLWAFIGGIRFDLVSISITNILFIFFSLLPFAFRANKLYQSLLKIIFIIFNGAALALNCIDLVYFRFTLKRTTADIFKLPGMQKDIVNLLPQFMVDYWYVSLIWLLLLILLFYLYKKTESKAPVYQGKISVYFGSQFLLLLLFSGLTILSIRGGTQGKPIGIITAGRHSTANNVPLVLNTPFTIIKSYESDLLEKKDYMTDGEAIAIYNPIKQYPTKEQFKNLNVVLIILESFSLEYTGLGKGKSYTPFLDSISNEGLAFTNAFANGKRSVEGIPSILSSLPTLMESPFISSPYSGNKINSLASLLGDKGYHSAFFHGGNNGTMGFDDFTALAGFDQYIGRMEYEAEKKNNGADYDGLWGIWDMPFFGFFADKLNHLPQPFFSSFFSLTSHHPFEVPKGYQHLENGSQEIHKSIRYADLALKNFFEQVKNAPWFENTLFVITADHTGPQNDPTTAQLIDNYRIPLIFYKKGSDLKGIEKKVVQQIDILPSVLNYLNYDKRFFSFGESFFAPNHEGFSINFGNNQYQLINNKYILSFDGTEIRAMNKHAAEIEDYRQQDMLKMERKIKSIIQVYNRSMIENKQYVQ